VTFLAKDLQDAGTNVLQSGIRKKFQKKAQKNTVEVGFFLQSKQEFLPLSAVLSVFSPPKRSE